MLLEFKNLFFVFLSLFACAEALLLDYFRLIGEKPDGHSFENIDFIYMINLDERPKKYARACSKLAPYGIYPFRFIAINGWKDLTIEDINDVGVWQDKLVNHAMKVKQFSKTKEFVRHPKYRDKQLALFSQYMTKGAIVIVLSHLSVLYDAYQSNYQTIWVMEDDIEIRQNPRCIPSLIEQLDKLVGKEGWDILFTDRDTRGDQGTYCATNRYYGRPDYIPDSPKRFSLNKPVGKNFRRIGARWGAYSMIIRRSGIIKLLEFFLRYQIFLPYDADFGAPNGMRLFTVRKDVVGHQIQRVSDRLKPTY